MKQLFIRVCVYIYDKHASIYNALYYIHMAYIDQYTHMQKLWDLHLSKQRLNCDEDTKRVTRYPHTGLLATPMRSKGTSIRCHSEIFIAK